MAENGSCRRLPDASPTLCALLDASRGPILAPIRAEIFGVQRFCQHARSLGQTHRAESMPLWAATFFPHLKSNMVVLREAHKYIGLQASTGYDISPAAEWLLDNFHTIEAQLKEIHDGLPRSYFRSLPMLMDAPLAGLPRIYGIAWAFVAHTDGAFDEELLVQFLMAYQETRELKLSEIWALPTTLRVVLVENLRRLAERVATSKAAREVANLCFDRIESYDIDALNHVLALLTKRGVGQVFLTQMTQRLQDRKVSGDDISQLSVQDWLRTSLPELGSMQSQQGADQAADNLSVSNAVSSLRAVGDANWPDIVARTSSLMRLMLTSHLFAAEDAATQDQTLHAIERLSKRSRLSEVVVATTLLDLMQPSEASASETTVAHHWLRGKGLPALLVRLNVRPQWGLSGSGWTARLVLPAYLGLLLGALFLIVWWLMLRPAAPFADSPYPWLHGVALLALVFPVSEALVAVLNRLISESARPRRLPRLAFADGIPPEHRVIVVIPGMLTSAASVADLAHRLELHYLANPEPQAQFALLTDWADAPAVRLPGDAPLLAAAQRHIDALNAQHPVASNLNNDPPRFIVLHRERVFSNSEQCWIGWERKRGKLERLIEALATGVQTAFIDLGPASRLAGGAQYVVTLDSDTQLPPGRLRELVGVAAHPHNQPRFDAGRRTVVSGYGILQPRIVTPLPPTNSVTLFHWMFAGQCGLDPYSTASSEVYQDLFHEGSFTGKGLLNVHAMHTVLLGRLPENQILSHDLLEGAIARCAAVSDIPVIEEAPFHADVAASRVHRWTRGDWQLLPLLGPSLRSEPQFAMRGINRWKMFDNLRRSLVAPMSLAVVLLSLAGVGVTPLMALALVLAAFSAGPLLGALAGFSPSRADFAKRRFLREAATELARVLWGGLWHLAQLLQTALMSLDAITRALYRTLVSRRKLLQWTTAATAQTQARTRLLDVLRLHRLQPVAAFTLMAALLALGTPHAGLAIVLCLLWAASPLWTWWVSRPCPVSQDAKLSVTERAYLEGIAHDTWRFFRQCVGAQESHLPPDNLQLTPYAMVAHRTSPTNIGMYLLSVTCARQFGWIGTQDVLTRLEATLATLQTLQRHRGHFLNWYDTQTGTPLMPMYVSTVDSGNLVGHLLTVAQACLELARGPFEVRSGQQALAALRQRMAPLLAARAQLSSPQRRVLRGLLADHRATTHSLERDVLAQRGADSQDRAAAEALASDRLRALAHAFTAMAWQADFSFLYHRKRHLFHIGYRVADQHLDAGFYDLLASESRLTSVLAIAKGDVPVRHWASLGRPFFADGFSVGLRSWTGSMFEYLMPTLVLYEPPGSVLRAACHAALHEQVAYAKGQGVPWGISESAYAAADASLAYQYAPQGAPRLALRRTPPDELVVAPYATALGALVSPRCAVDNFRLLESLGARGPYGFVEALDYTAARRISGQPFAIVDTVMAHHQGMSIAALANVLLGDPVQRWGMANAPIEAVASLLHERLPREVSLLNTPPPAAQASSQQRRRVPTLLREVIPGTQALDPSHVLSNGRYSVCLRANGAGWSRWGQVGITRQRDDALRDALGSFFYLRWNTQHHPVSLTQHPAPDANARYTAVFHADRVSFEATWPNLKAHTTVWVSPEDDIELRTVELLNLDGQTLDLELISAFDVTLTERLADEAHPAFTNLFVRAQWLAAQQALLFERKPRLATEKTLKAVHFLATTDERIVGTRIQTDRQRWLGRNHGTAQPAAALDAVPSGPSGDHQVLRTGLDPVCVLAVQLRIPPHGRLALTFATAVADHETTLHAVIDKYRQHTNVERASLMSATLMGIRLRSLRISAASFSAMQTMSTGLLLSMSRPALRGAKTRPPLSEVCDRRLLWRFGISGDRALILVSAADVQGLGLIRAMAQALTLWAWGGVACDLVIVNSEPISYSMLLQSEIAALRERHVNDTAAHPGGAVTGFHVLRGDDLSTDEMSTLKALARVRIHADGRPLDHHVLEWMALHEQAQDERQHHAIVPVPCHGTVGDSTVGTPMGEFVGATQAFHFDVSDRLRPTRPWINVLSNPRFGTQVSEAGSGYTWAVNSRLNQLTAWSNDPVADPPAEWLLLQDCKTQDTWSATPNAWSAPGERYHVAHEQGVTVISHRRGRLEVSVSWCVDVETSVKQISITLRNLGHKPLHMRLVGLAEWMMGANRSDRSTVRSASYTLPMARGQLQVLTATQMDRSAGFGAGTAFLCAPNAVEELGDWTCDRRECFDAAGQLVVPAHFGQRSGSGLDPCAALGLRLEVMPGESVERSFLLGYANDAPAALQLASTAAAVAGAQRVQQVRDYWNQLLGTVTVKTPDPLFDAMVNRWLLYQAVSCRLWAKAGFYQAGGATGYRDQLQDAMALVWTAPQMLRQQIVLCASRQFEAGDVQHWWHAPLGAGVRTHFSDDLLWLASATAHYLRATGDTAVLDERIPFLEGMEIPPGAEDAYFTPTVSARQATLYEHVALAMDRSLRVGVHGLPLMGSGDWNDGMNRVGIEGRGESVWLGWFLCQLVTELSPLARARGDLARVTAWDDAAVGWKAALNGPAWDGQWFKRAFFDDGQPLGSQANAEAHIDLIAQAWAVLSHAATPDKQGLALQAMDALLVDPEMGLIKLLDPPLQHAQPSAGYIQAYPPGVRENGGQYAHAGVWALMAVADYARNNPQAQTHKDDVYRYFTYLSPAHRAKHVTRGPRLGTEPYVMTADIYTQPPYVGRGGWSWYTGAAAWMHRGAIESVFGLQWGTQELFFQPCLPSHWYQAEITLVRAGRSMHFVLVNDSLVNALLATGLPASQALTVGQALRWTTLPHRSSFVLALQTT